jgi:hypothetical protein
MVMAHSLQLGACHFFAQGLFNHLIASSDPDISDTCVICVTNLGIDRRTPTQISPRNDNSVHSLKIFGNIKRLEVPPGLLGKRINLPVRG